MPSSDRARRIAQVAAYTLYAGGSGFDVNRVAVLSAEMAKQLDDAGVSHPVADASGAVLVAGLALDGALMPGLDAIADVLTLLNRPAGRRIARFDVKLRAARTNQTATAALASAMHKHFRRAVQATAAKVVQLDVEPDPEHAADQAAAIMGRIYDAEHWYADTVESSAKPMGQAFAEGALVEVAMYEHLVRSGRGKATTAEEIATRLDIEVPPGVAIGEMPEWLLDAARSQLGETFQQDYWKDIDVTTGQDITRHVERTIMDSATEGWSTRRLASSINEQFGDQYTMRRATNVARTEVGNMLNAGHTAGITHVAEETGLPMGKEWISVLGSTTRDTHAEADGQQTETPDGMFTVGGHETPWPAHWSLPAGERSNCQCSVISTAVMDEIADAPEDLWTQDAVDKMDVKTIAAGHPVLREKHEKVLKFAKGSEKRLQKTFQKADAASRAVSTHTDEIMQPIWDKIQTFTGDVRSEEYKKLAAEMHAEDEEHQKLVKKRSDATRSLDAFHERENKTLVKKLAVPAGERFTLQPSFNAKGTAEISPEGVRVSTGQWTKQDKTRVKEAQTFLGVVTKSTFATPELADKAAMFHVHIGDKELRAFCRSHALIFQVEDKYETYGVHGKAGETTDIWVHEMGHHLENMRPGVQKRAVEFRDYRIAQSGKPVRQLKEVFPESGFREYEKGSDDTFGKAFDRLWNPDLAPDYSDISKIMGPSHFGFYTGKIYHDNNTEIVSMGVQLLYNDPGGFARRDPEYFKFIVGVLDGTIK